MTYLSLIVLIPMAAVVESSVSEGLGQFWDSATRSRRRSPR